MNSVMYRKGKLEGISEIRRKKLNLDLWKMVFKEREEELA